MTQTAIDISELEAALEVTKQMVKNGNLTKEQITAIGYLHGYIDRLEDRLDTMTVKASDLEQLGHDPI